jgi:hypothetical protein
MAIFRRRRHSLPQDSTIAADCNILAQLSREAYKLRVKVL